MHGQVAATEPIGFGPDPATAAAGARRPRLLAVCPVPLTAQWNGYTLRVGHLVRELGRRWRISLIAPSVSSDAEAVFPAEELISAGANGPGTPRPSPYPNLRLQEAVDRVIARSAPSAALLWGGAEYLAFGRRDFPPAVADRIDSMTLITLRDARTAATLVQRFRILRDAAWFARYERRVVRTLAATVVVGEHDAAVLRRVSGRSSVHVVPNGVALEAPSDAGAESAHPSVVLSGTLAYPPNVDAAVYFVRSVWPAIRKAVPTARLLLAGRYPVAEVLALGREPGVEVLANVPDMAAVLRGAWVAVAPMRSGAGIKNKVLEAWAVGTPVVMSRLACNGLSLDAAARSLIADDAAAQAALVIRLLRDAPERWRLGTAAYELARREHSWAEAAARISELLEAACRGAVSAEGRQRSADGRSARR
jgi:glycosyltransferase involved in cell wall biosynthesis